MMEEYRFIKIFSQLEPEMKPGFFKPQKKTGTKFGELNSHSRDQDMSQKRKLKKLCLFIFLEFVFAEEKAKNKKDEKTSIF